MIQLSPRQKKSAGNFRNGTIQTDDNVQITYQVFGDGSSDKKTVVFANGIGVRFPGALLQIEVLRDKYRVITWDYRGMWDAHFPHPQTTDVSMNRQAKDILAILDHEKIDQAIFMGWSMGVQVSLEAIRLAPHRVIGLIALLGTYARVFHTAFSERVAEKIDEFIVFQKNHPKIAQFLLDLALVLPQVAFALVSRLAFVGKDADREMFFSDVRSVATTFKEPYWRAMLELDIHNAEDILDKIACPALIICGERDYLTPCKVGMHMANRIKGAMHHQIKGGTHFAPIEQPEKVNRLILEFLEKNDV